MARRLLIAFVIAAAALVGGVAGRLVPAQPTWVWWLAPLPIASLVGGPRTPAVVVAALIELATLVPLQGFVTLVRAARLEGG